MSKSPDLNLGIHHCDPLMIQAMEPWLILLHENRQPKSRDYWLSADLVTGNGAITLFSTHYTEPLYPEDQKGPLGMVKLKPKI